MQQRFTTQGCLLVGSQTYNHGALKGLDGAEAVLDWTALEGMMSGIYSSHQGRPSYPLLTLFRSLLLGIWYKLSDEQLSQCLVRDLLFRKFCRLELDTSIPDATTLGRFRTKLMQHDLWEVLLGEVNRQLETQHIIMTEGRINIIDATPIEAAQSGKGKGKDEQPTKDADAGWHVKKDARGNMKSTYGYSVHSAVDEDGFIHRQEVTAGNVHDSQMLEHLVLGTESQLYADAAYSSHAQREMLKRFDIADKVHTKGYRNNPLRVEEIERNKEISVTRSGGERPFATYKRHYGLARTRFMGLAKNMTFFAIAAIAHNIQKAVRFFVLYGVKNPNYAG